MSDLKDTWRTILQRIEPTIGRSHFVTWFQNTGIVKFESDVLVIGTPNPYAKNWLETRYPAKIFGLVKEYLPTCTRIAYEIVSSFANGNDPQTVPLEGILSAPEKTVRKIRSTQEVEIDGELRSRMFNSKYRLDNFIAGRNNRLPHAAAMAVSSQPGGIYNPLFLYGSVGLGKTHLLQATGNEILKNYPKKIVVYITSEHFVNQVVEAIKMRKMKELKERYRKADCLIVDDVQFFCEKPSSQDEFFHTFNDLYDANKQILLSSDRAPKDLEGLDDRLRSRFGMGMVTEVLPAEYETRLAILQTKCQESGVLLDQEVLACIAYHVEKSVRDLEGALTSLMGRMRCENITPTVNDALEVVRKLHGEKQDSRFPSAVRDLPYAQTPASVRRFVRDTAEILSVVSKYFRISKQDIVGDDRRKEILLPRQICMYLIRHELNEAYEKIGADFGGKNHTTVLHACNKIIQLLKEDPRIVRDVTAIKTELGL